MKTKQLSLTILIILGASMLFAANAYAGKIIVPWRAKKEIVKQGSNFDIWFDKGKTETITSVSLVGPFNKVKLKIKQNKEGSWYYDEYTKASYNCQLSVKVPKGTPEELYDLVVETSAGVYTSRSAVKVIKEYLNHYYICNFTDPHVSVSWDENGNATAPIMQALGEIISVINPAFAVSPGDNIIGFSRTPIIPKNYSERWDAFWDGTTADGLGGMHNTRVPVYITSGNNDYDKHRENQDAEKMYKLTDWNEQCGMRVFGFAYDQTRILAFDDYLGEAKDHGRFTGTSKDFPVKQRTVLEKYLNEAGAGKLRIVLQHAPNRVDTVFCNKNKVELVLCGHTHRDYEFMIGTTPTKVCETVYVCFAEYWSPAYGPPAESGITKLRIIEVKDNKIASNQSVDIMDYVQVMKGNTDGKFLNVTYDKPNDGKSAFNTAILNNKIDYNFTSCNIRFVMPKGKYTINNGTLLQSFSNDKVSIYDVKMPVSASSRVSVTIKPID